MDAELAALIAAASAARSFTDAVNACPAAIWTDPAAHTDAIADARAAAQSLADALAAADVLPDTEPLDTP